jgi:hypothetical protein
MQESDRFLYSLLFDELDIITGGLSVPLAALSDGTHKRLCEGGYVFVGMKGGG